MANDEWIFDKGAVLIYLDVMRSDAVDPHKVRVIDAVIDQLRSSRKKILIPFESEATALGTLESEIEILAEITRQRRKTKNQALDIILGAMQFVSTFQTIYADQGSIKTSKPKGIPSKKPKR